jgi:hypothetical protein
MPTQKILLLACAALLAGCSSERHFARDSWPLGNPNRPPAASETAQISLGHRPVVEALAPQAGSVWPGAVQPVPTIAEEQKAMNQPLGSAYTPSLPSPYPPGEEPPANPDLGNGPLGPPGSQNFSLPDDGGPSGGDLAPLTGPITPTTPTPTPTQ